MVPGALRALCRRHGELHFAHDHGQRSRLLRARERQHLLGCELPWIETFDLNIDGGKLVTVKQMLPDIEGAITNVLYSLFYRNSRSLGLVELQSPPRTVRSDGYVDFRTTGRDIRLRIELATPPA